MSMSLMFTSDEISNRGTSDWAAIQEVSDVDGLVWIEDSTVDACARLLQHAVLSTGKPVLTFDHSDEEYHESFVSDFGPSLLDEETREALRELLETDRKGGEKAAALFDLICERQLMINLVGKDITEPYLAAVNTPADTASIDLGSGSMYAMLKKLGIETDAERETGETSLEIFEKAVNDNADMTDCPASLRDFLECARRNGASQVYWA